MNIMFVCTGNTCRSPMAEGFMKHICKKNNIENVNVISAGISADEGAPVSHNAMLAADEYGVDISDHPAANLNMNVIVEADYIFTMTSVHSAYLKKMFPDYSGKIYSVGEFTGTGDRADPFGGDIKTYILCAKQLYDAVNNIYLKLYGNANENNLS